MAKRSPNVVGGTRAERAELRRMLQDPKVQEHLRKGLEDVRRGNLTPLEEVEATLRRGDKKLH
jgi:hypothetical protein